MKKEKERIQVALDSTLKHEAEEILQDLGMNSTTAITVFYKQIVEQGGLPFTVQLSEKTNQSRRLAKLAKKSPNVVYIDSNEELENWLSEDE